MKRVKKKIIRDKYYLGEFKDQEKHKGWFVGSFFEKDHPCKTDYIEILYKEHKEGDTVDPHFHKKKIELLIMLNGKAEYKVNGKRFILESGKFLFVDVNNVISGEFVKPSKLFAIHSPSIPTDKYLV